MAVSYLAFFFLVVFGLLLGFDAVTSLVGFVVAILVWFGFAVTDLLAAVGFMSMARTGAPALVVGGTGLVTRGFEAMGAGVGEGRRGGEGSSGGGREP